MIRRPITLVILAWVAVCIVVGGAALARATDAAAGHYVWATYTNVRFQYSICYPRDLFLPQGESENADGEKFLGSGGARLIVFGQNNALDQNLKEVLADTAARLAGSSGKVTYKVAKPDWFVVSGQNGQTIFYAKTLRSHDQFKSFELTYDRSEAAIYEPLITRLASCFKDLGS